MRSQESNVFIFLKTISWLDWIRTIRQILNWGWGSQTTVASPFDPDWNFIQLAEHYVISEWVLPPVWEGFHALSLHSFTSHLSSSPSFSVSVQKCNLCEWGSSCCPPPGASETPLILNLWVCVHMMNAWQGVYSAQTVMWVFVLLCVTIKADYTETFRFTKTCVSTGFSLALKIKIHVWIFFRTICFIIGEHWQTT